MRIETSLSDAVENKNGEPVILIPRVWDLAYRAGMAILLLSVVLATVGGGSQDITETATLGTLLLLVAFLGPYIHMAGQLFITLEWGDDDA